MANGPGASHRTSMRVFDHDVDESPLTPLRKMQASKAQSGEPLLARRSRHAVIQPACTAAGARNGAAFVLPRTHLVLCILTCVPSTLHFASFYSKNLASNREIAPESARVPEATRHEGELARGGG